MNAPEIEEMHFERLKPKYIQNKNVSSHSILTPRIPMYQSKGSLTTRSYIDVKGNFSKYLHLYKQNKRDKSNQIKINNTNKLFYNEFFGKTKEPQEKHVAHLKEEEDGICNKKEKECHKLFKQNSFCYTPLGYVKGFEGKERLKGFPGGKIVYFIRKNGMFCSYKGVENKKLGKSFQERSKNKSKVNIFEINNVSGIDSYSTKVKGGRCLLNTNYWRK